MLRRRWMRLLALIALPILGALAVATPALAAVSGETTFPLVAPSDNPTQLSPSPDGTMLYVTDWQHNLLLQYDLRAHAWLDAVSVINHPIGVAVTPNGKKVLVAGNGGIDIVDAGTRHVTHIAGTGVYESIAVTPDGRYAFAGSDGEFVTKLNLASGSITDIRVGPVGGGGQPAFLAITPDGARVYVASSTANVVNVITTATNAVSSDIVVGSTPFEVAVSGNGKRVYVLNRDSSTVSVISTATNSVIATVPAGDHPHGVAVSPDSSQFVVSSTYTQQLLFFSAATNTQIESYTIVAGSGSSQPGALAFAPNGASFYASLPGDTSIGDFTIDPPLPYVAPTPAPTPTPTPTSTQSPLPNTGQNLTPVLVVAVFLLVAGASAAITVAVRKRRR